MTIAVHVLGEPYEVVCDPTTTTVGDLKADLILRVTGAALNKKASRRWRLFIAGDELLDEAKISEYITDRGGPVLMLCPEIVAG